MSKTDKINQLFLKEEKLKNIQSLNFSEEIKRQRDSGVALRRRAIIKDINKKFDYEEMDGLRLLNPIQEVIAWTVLSTPAESYRKILKFFYDAFVVIESSKQLRDLTITLYNRDIRSQKDFDQRSCNFLTGEKIN